MINYSNPEHRLSQRVTVGVNQVALIAPDFDTSKTPVVKIDSSVVGGNVWGAVISDRTLGIAAISIPRNTGDLKPAISAAAKVFTEFGSKRVDLVMVAGPNLLKGPHRDFREDAMARALAYLGQRSLQVIGGDWQEIKPEEGVRIDAREGTIPMPLAEQFDPRLHRWALQQRVIAIAESLIRRPDLKTSHPYSWAYRPTQAA